MFWSLPIMDHFFFQMKEADCEILKQKHFIEAVEIHEETIEDIERNEITEEDCEYIKEENPGEETECIIGCTEIWSN